MAGGQINFKVGYTVDKTALQQIKTSLQEIQNMTANDLVGKGLATNIAEADSKLKLAQQDAQALSNILTQSFNKDLGTVNIQKFNNALQTSNIDLNKVYTSMAAIGTKGVAAFRDMATQVMTSNLQLKKTHNLLDSMAETMGNTIKWGIASSIMNSFTGKVREAYSYVKNLDGSLNDIRIVTGKSADEMERFADRANKAAKQLGTSTKAYADASLIYYQQGLSDEDVAARAEVTSKVSNVTGQSTEEVSEQLTAVWNGYKVSAEEAESYIDKLSAVAATTASDLEELSKGMSKVASAANSMGVDIDQLNAQISTIISVTRQAPESVGTALKTIYARMGDLAVDGEDEFGTKLGEVSGKMAQMGIQVLDQQGNLRDMGIIIEETAAKWDTWTDAQKQAAAVAMAGKRQYNNLIALFDNWDMYTQALNTSQNSLGQLQTQEDIYLESTEAHLQRMKTAWEDVYDSMLDEDTINGFADFWGGVGNVLATVIDGAGGGGNALLMLGTILTRVFNKQIAASISNFVINLRNGKTNAEQLAHASKFLESFNTRGVDEATQQLFEMGQAMSNLSHLMSPEQYNQGNVFIKQQKDLFNTKEAYEDAVQAALDYYNNVTGKKVDSFVDSKTGEITEAGKGVDATDLDVVEEEYLSNQHLNETKESYEAIQALKQKNLALSRNIGKQTKEEVSAGSSLEKIEEERSKLIAKHKEEISKEGGELQKVKKAYYQIDEAAEHIGDSLILPESITQKAKTIAATFKSSLGDMSIEDFLQTNEGILALEKYERELEELQQEIRDTNNAHKQMLNPSEVTGKVQEINTALEQNGQKSKQFFKDIITQQDIQTVTSYVNSLSQIFTVINMLTNLPDIINNEDLSAGEKASQIMSMILSAAGMLLMAIPALTAAKTAMIPIISGWSVAMGGAKIATDSLTKAMWTLMTTTPIGWILAAVAALIGLGTALYFAATAESKEEKEAQKAAETAKALSENLNETRQEADKLFAAFDEYDNAVKALSECVKGTDEWNAALKHVNETVLNLLKDFPELAKYKNLYHRDEETGMLVLNEDVVEDIKEDAEQRVSVAEAATLMSAGYASKARVKADSSDISSGISLINAQYTDSGVYYDQDYVKASKVLTENAEKLMGLTAEEYKAKVSELLSSAGIQADKIKTMADMLMPYQEKLGDLGKATDEAATQISNAALTIANSALGDEFDAATTKIASNTYDDDYEDIYDEIMELSDDNSKGDKSTDASDEIWERFEKATGKTYTQSDNTIQGTDANRVYAYKGEDGEETFTAEYMAQTIAAYEAMQKLGQNAEAAAETLGNLDKTAGSADIAQGVKNWIVSDNFASMNQATYDSMRDEIANVEHGSGKVDAAGIEAYLDKMFGDGKDGTISESTAKKYGFDSVEDMVEDYQQKMTDYATEANKIRSNMGGEAGSVYDDLDTSEMSLEGKKAIATFLTNTFEEGGQEGLDKASGLLHGMSSKEAIELAKKYSDGFNAEKYSEYINSEFDKKAEELEIDKEEFQAYKKLLKETTSAYKDNEAGLNAVALANKRLEKGVKSIASNWEDFDKIMSDSSSTAEDISTILPEVNKGLQDILNIDNKQFELLPATFAQDNWNLIQQVVDGVEGSVDKLRDKAGQSILLNIDGAVDPNGKIKGELQTIHDQIASMDKAQFKVGIALDENDNAKFIANCEAMIKAANMTAEQAQAYFASMGYDVELEEVSPEKETTTEYSYYELDEAQTKKAGGVPQFKSTATTIPITSTSSATAYAIKTITPNGSYGGGVGVNTTAPKSATNVKSSKKKKKESITINENPYRTVDSKLTQTENELVKLEKEREKLSGGALLKNLNKQLKNLEQQRNLQKEKLEIAKQEEKRIRDEIQNAGNDGLSFGIQFDNEGNITNYDEIAAQELAALNEAERKFNASKQDEDDQEALDKARERYETFTSLIDEYDEVHDSTISEIEQRMQDLYDRMIEMQIESFQYEIQLTLDAKEAQRDWNEFKKNMTIDEDDILGNTKFAFDNFKTYMGDNGTIATLTNKSNTLLDQLKQINETGTSSIYGNNKAKLMEDLQAVQEQLMEEMQNQKDILDEIEAAYVNMLDAAQEAFDEQIAQYEAINEVYSHGLNVINLMYGEDAYAEMEGFYQKQMQNNNQMIDMQRRTVDFYKQQLENASLTDEQREEVQRKLQEAQAALHASVESQVELIITKYTNAINKIFKELEDKMTGGMGLSHIQEEWDLINQNAEMYLDQINSAYEIEKLTREYNKAIDATSSLSAQRKLNELMEQQLKGLREKDKLTQYEVDRANVLLDIELKKIALEEAQQNKSKMRLRKDASGNYSYQFVSDEDATAQAQQELADAQNSLYNLDKDALQENQEAALNMWTEFKDKYIEILSDVTLTDEEREARLQLIREQYGEMYNNLLLQNADIRKNLEETALTEMSQMNLDYMMNDIVPTWDTGVQQMMDAFTGEGGLLPACSAAFGELTTLVGEYDADLALLEQNAGYSLGQIATYTQTVAEQMTPVLEDNDELISKYETQIGQLGIITDAVAGLKGEYKLLTTEANAAADAILKARYAEAGLDENGNPLPDLTPEETPDNSGDTSNGGDSGSSGSSGSSNQPVDNSSKAEGVAAAIWLDGSTKSGWGTGNTRASRLSAKGVAAAQSIINSQGPNGQLYSKWMKKDRSAFKYGAFDTGGYTGEWGGDDGRLAILHKKELVLNAEDTKNILQAVDIVRHIDGIMESVMGNAFSRINNQINGLNAMNIPIGGPTSSEAAVAQHIEINADFPGVERASEIISAFENLTNMATQYAFRSNR